LRLGTEAETASTAALIDALSDRAISAEIPV
jgi:hypothetical protein